MKLAILTFHAAENYGAVLQAYALQEYLKSTGNQVEIIDYRPEYLINGYRIFPKSRYNGIKGLIRVIVRELINFSKMGHYLFLKIIKKKKFNKFCTAYLILTKKTYSKLNENLEYDVIFFGSDQIWSLQHNCKDEAFFGNIPTNVKTLKIAYAASAGNDFKNIKDCEVFRKNITNFDAIGVRETALYDTVKTCYNKRLETVLDPVLLANVDIWNKFTDKPIINKKYVVVYEMIDNKKLIKFAQNIAKQINAEVVKIWDGNKMRWNKYTRKSGPGDFVNIIKYASCVITTSFHAVAFSLIFKRDFYFLSSNVASEDRIKNILSQLKLSNRFTTDINTKFSEVDWDLYAVDEKLNELRNSSKEFVDYSLKLSKQ